MKKGARRKPRKVAPLQERVDETFYLSKKRGGGVLKEEVWYEGAVVVKYSLAYINEAICAGDNGRVLGYDNGHGVHHRHFMGNVEKVKFTSYTDLARRFQAEVQQMWRVQGEEKG